MVLRTRRPPECLWEGIQRTVNTISLSGEINSAGQFSFEPFTPTPQLHNGEVTFGGFTYSALEEGSGTPCFRLQVALKRPDFPSAFGCPPDESSEMIRALGLSEAEYTTVVAESSRIIITSPRVVLLNPKNNNLKVKAGSFFAIDVSLTTNGTNCWEGSCGEFRVRMVVVSGPSSECPNCKTEIKDEAGIAKFSYLDLKKAGTYLFAIVARSVDASELAAPAYLTIQVIPGDPAGLVFLNCPRTPEAYETYVAGTMFTKRVEVRDKYQNPTQAWNNDIVLSAVHEGEELEQWKQSPPTAQTMATTTAVFRLMINQALAGGSYTIVASSRGMYNPGSFKSSLSSSTLPLVSTQQTKAGSVPAATHLVLTRAECTPISIKPSVPAVCRAAIDHTLLKAGLEFRVRVTFYDKFDNRITGQVSNGGKTAVLGLLGVGGSQVKGSLRGTTTRVINGPSILFTGLRYEAAPDSVRISVSVPGAEDLSSCITEPLRIIPDDPSQLKVVKIAKKSGDHSQKPPLGPIIGPESGNHIGSPLRAGEPFCVHVNVCDKYGNIVVETDPTIRQQYPGVGESTKPPYGVPFYSRGYGGIGGKTVIPSDSVSDVLPTGSMDGPGVQELRRIAAAGLPSISEDRIMGTGGRSFAGAPSLRMRASSNPPMRKVKLTRKGCHPGLCKSEGDKLKGEVVLASLSGQFQFCDVWYERSECIISKASSAGLAPAESPRICIDHGPWEQLRCTSDVRRVPLNEAMGIFHGDLLDAYGNPVTSCDRDFPGGCNVVISELPEKSGYIPGGRLSNPSLPPGSLVENVSPKGNLVATAENGNAHVSFNYLLYTRIRLTSDPLRLELRGRAGVRANCEGAVVVVGYQMSCTDSPSEVTAGEEFDVSAEITSYDNMDYGRIICPGDLQCSSEAFITASGGSSVNELRMFSFLRRCKNERCGRRSKLHWTEVA